MAIIVIATQFLDIKFPMSSMTLLISCSNIDECAREHPSALSFVTIALKVTL